MAYREFQNEKIYEAPNLGDLPRTLHAMQVAQQVADQRKQRIYDTAKDVKTFQATTKIPKYVEGVNELAGKATKARMGEIYQGYQVPTQQTKELLDLAPKLNQAAIANEEELKRLHDQIISNNDPYYKRDVDLNKAAGVIQNTGEQFGEELLNKDAAKITQLRGSLNSDEDVLNNYAADKAAADWVQKHKMKTFGTDYKDVSGAKSGSLISGLFFDKNGSPAVTDEHITDFLNYHPKQKPYYTHLAMNDIMDDIDKARAADPNFMKGVSDSEALSSIVQNPSLDPINQQPINERARSKVKSTIESLEGITKKLDTDLSDYSPSSRKYGSTNKNIQIAEGFENKNFSSPSMAIVNPKSPTNPYLRLSTAANLRYNLDNGAVVKNKLPREFILNGGVQMVPVKANGEPVNIEATSEEDLLKKIKELPASAFTGPDGIVGTKMAMRGQSVNKKQILDMAFTKVADLKNQLASDPSNPGIQQQLNATENILQQINADTELSPELIQKYLGVDVVQNELIPLDPNDPNVQQIQGLTGGMNVYSKKVLNNFSGLQNAISQRLKQSKEVEVPAVKAYQQTEEGKKAFEKIKSKTTITPVDFDTKWKALKSGEKLIGPDGIEYTKQ